ncbi:MAG: NosD domain-containing protein [Promethearchaeota archaeon]
MFIFIDVLDKKTQKIFFLIIIGSVIFSFLIYMISSLIVSNVQINSVVNINGNDELDAFFDEYHIKHQDGSSWEKAYILDGLKVKIKNKSLYCLYLQNIDRYIIIRNAYFLGSSYQQTSGVYLYNASNVRIENANFKYCKTGVKIVYSRNVIIFGSYFGTGTDYGVYIQNSFNVSVDNNEFYYSDRRDIYIDASFFCNITSNKLSGKGIDIDNFEQALEFLNESGHQDNPNYNVYNIDSNNIYDLPVLYYENKNDLNVELNNRSSGELIIINCTNANFSNLITKQLLLIHSGPNEFINISITDSRTSGFKVMDSKNVTFSFCNLNKNTFGFKIYNSNFTRIRKSLFINNTYGIYSWYSYNTSLEENNFTMRERGYMSYGVKLYYSNNNSVRDNYFDIDSASYALYFDNSNKNSIVNNKFYAPKPIYNVFSSNISYIGNDFINPESINSLLNENFSLSNTINGKKIMYFGDNESVISIEPADIINVSLIAFNNCSNFSINDIVFSDISYTPIRILNSCYNFTLFNVTINISNAKYGASCLYIESSKNGLIANSSFICSENSSSTTTGVIIISSTYINMSNNEVHYEDEGIYMTDSAYLNISHNRISYDKEIVELSDYDYYGIYSSYSYNITLADNMIRSRGVGIKVYYSNKFTIRGNQITLSQIGVILFQSHRNQIIQNNITYLKNCMSILIEYVNTTGDNNISDNICHAYNNDEPENNTTNTNYKIDLVVNIGIILGSMAVTIVVVYLITLYFHKWDLKIKNNTNRQDLPSEHQDLKRS